MQTMSENPILVIKLNIIKQRRRISSLSEMFRVDQIDKETYIYSIKYPTKPQY